MHLITDNKKTLYWQFGGAAGKKYIKTKGKKLMINSIFIAHFLGKHRISFIPKMKQEKKNIIKIGSCRENCCCGYLFNYKAKQYLNKKYTKM